MLIVLLYGSLERYIEDLAEEYLNAYKDSLNDFSDFPKRIQETHFDVTLEYLKLSATSYYRGNATKSDLARSIYTCHDEKQVGHFITEPFLRHTSNFRISAIDDFFNRIGAPSVLRSSAARREASGFIQETGFQVSEGRHERLWSRLDELVEDRNRIAHGDLSNIASSTTISDYCSLLSALAICLNAQIRDVYCSHFLNSHGRKIGNPVAIFSNGIFGIRTAGVPIEVDSMLCCENSEGFTHSLKVLEIHVDGKPAERTPNGEDVQVGLKVDGICRRNHTISLIHSSPIVA